MIDIGPTPCCYAQRRTLDGQLGLFQATYLIKWLSGQASIIPYGCLLFQLWPWRHLTELLLFRNLIMGTKLEVIAVCTESTHSPGAIYVKPRTGTGPVQSPLRWPIEEIQMPSNINYLTSPVKPDNSLFCFFFFNKEKGKGDKSWCNYPAGFQPIVWYKLLGFT